MSTPRSLLLSLSFCALACTSDAGSDTDTDTDAPGTSSGDLPTSGGTSTPGTSGSGQDTDPIGSTTTGMASTGSDETDSGGQLEPVTVAVQLVPNTGVSGLQRVNFAVPLAPGVLSDDQQVVVEHGGEVVAAASRGLAPHPDGSFRAVQIQVELEVSAETALQVTLGGDVGLGGLELVPVEDTLVEPDASAGPNVWAVLPATWLAESGVAGPLAAAETFAGNPEAAWLDLCDHATWNTEAFLAVSSERGPWLYDRGTTLARAYATTGDLEALRSQYRETGIYGLGITGEGADVAIPVPDAGTDAKYHYGQNLAVHYLLTGDDRFRERAEDIAERMATLWSDPGYAGGADFWTERHAGFALLAYVAAAQVSDDRSATYLALADEAVQAYLSVMDTYPEGWDDADARCFAHHADAHGEGYGYFGCSPWMSAILADALEQYAQLRGGTEADDARAAIVRMGRLFARDGLDPSGKPFYWMGIGGDQDEVDGYDEHWGEAAYVIAMAWHYAPEDEPMLREAALSLVDGLDTQGTAPHIRSYNWQCRSAIAAPYYLQSRPK